MNCKPNILSALTLFLLTLVAYDTTNSPDGKISEVYVNHESI